MSIFDIAKSVIDEKPDSLFSKAKTVLDELPGAKMPTTVESPTPINPQDALNPAEKVLTNPVVAKIIDSLSGGMQKVTGMTPPEQAQAADRNVAYLKSIPQMFMNAVPEPADLVNPGKLVERAGNTLGAVSAPFMPAFGATESGIQSGLKGQSLPEIIQATAKGAADPTNVKLMTDPQNIPLQPSELQGGVASLIPRAIMQGVEQMALGHLMGAPDAIGKAVEGAKVQGVAKDFESAFAKIDPKNVQDHLESQGLFKPEMTDAEKSDMTTAVMAHLKESLKANPAVGDYFIKLQTLPKLAGDAEMALREGLKTDIPLKPGERGSTGVPDEQSSEVTKPNEPVKPEAIQPPKPPDVPAILKAEIMGGQPSTQPPPSGQVSQQPQESPHLGNIIKDIQSETIQEKAAREVQEFSAMPKGNKTFGFSPDVNQHLKSMKNVEAVQQQLATQLPAQDVRKIINSNVGVKKSSPVVQMSEKAALKRELGQEQKASIQGAKEGRGRAIAELKNLFGNQTEALKRQAELQRIKDDIIARDKSGAKFETYKSKSEAKLDVAKREAELQRLQDDIVARDKVRVKKEIIAYAKEKLPVESQGKFLTAIGNAHTASHLSAAFRRVEQEATNVERADIVKNLKAESSKAMESGKVAVEYKQMINEIMGGIELKKRRPETLDRLRRTREHIEKQRATGKDIEMPDRILNQLEILHRRSVDQLTVGELKNIHANIQDLVKLGQTKLKAREAIYDMQKERITKDLIAGTVPLDKNPLIVAEPGEKLTPMDKFKNVFKKVSQGLQHLDLVITPMDTFFDLMDGGHAKFDGPNYRHYKKQMDTAYQSFLRDSNADAQSMVALTQELKLDDQNFERIGVYAQTLQEGGREKLLDRGMTEKQINAINLTDAEMKWYKAGRKLLEAVRPGIEETMKNVWNKPLGHVKNYWPMMTDFEKLTDTEIFERFGESMPEIVHPTKKTAQGFTKERTGGYQPIKINAMDVLLKHLDDAHYLINMSRDIKMLSEIANNPKVKEASGDLGTVLTKEWLDLMARKGGVAGQIRIQILDTLRKNFGIAQLGLNVTSALIQPTALLDGAAIIGNYAFDGAYQVIANPEISKFVLENMPEIKSRLGEDPAFADYGDNKFMTLAGQVGYAPLKYFDGKTAMGVAYGAYMQKMKELGISIDLKNPNKEALNYAQEIVRQTQSSQFFKDSPSVISRGKLTGNKSFDKALTQFQSFMLTRWNIMRNSLWRASIQGGRDAQPGTRNFKKAFTIVGMLTLALLLETEIRKGIKHATDKLTGNVSKEKSTFSEDFLQNLISTVPFISQTISMAAYKSDAIPSFSGVRNVAEGVGSVSSKIKDAVEGKKIKVNPKEVIDFASGVGSVLGIPGTSQATKLAKSNVDSDSKGSAINLYEQAMRTPDQKERDKLWAKADQLAVENRVLKEDAQDIAEKRIRKEIEGIYQQAILENDDKSILEKADKIGKTAKFSDDELDDMYNVAKNRIDKGAEKAQAIEDQSRTYKPRPGIFDEAKRLMSSFK